MSAAPILVEIFEAKPHPGWPDELTRLLRFLRYSAPVACAECGRRRKTHWTMLISFTAKTMPKNAFVVHDSGTVHDPLRPVCRAHLLAPVLPEEQEAGSEEPDAEQPEEPEEET